MRSVVVVGAVILGLGVMSTACGDDAGSDAVPTADGTRFMVNPGDEFTITLESNMTTGFSWQLEVQPPAQIVVLVDDTYVAPKTDRVGAGGRQELTFRAVGDGSTLLELWYVRPFDDPPQPEGRAQFEVIVGSGTARAISVSDALVVADGTAVVVSGSLFDDGAGMVMCGALAESFPPQCPGDALAISNPDAITVEFTTQGGVRWTDRVVTVEGTVTNGSIDVSAVRQT